MKTTKPKQTRKPRVLWVLEYSDGDGLSTYNNMKRSVALKYASRAVTLFNPKPIKFVEVM